MFLIMALLFIGLPIFEIWLLIEVGGLIGTWPTLGLCVLTGVVGAWLSRAQGTRTLHTMRARLRRGEMPAREMIDAAMILVAAVTLMTPGLVTDAAGLILLTPPGRALARHLLASTLKARVVDGRSRRWSEDPRDVWGGPSARREPDRRDAPDVEFLPPGEGPKPPRRRPPPDVIDVD